MGLSLQTALMIATNKLLIQGLPSIDGKYYGYIGLMKDKILHANLLTTEPVYNNSKDAKKDMQKIAAWCIKKYREE